nr:hypothetical protein CFP56_59623 [Quercus suber]
MSRDDSRRLDFIRGRTRTSARTRARFVVTIHSLARTEKTRDSSPLMTIKYRPSVFPPVQMVPLLHSSIWLFPVRTIFHRGRAAGGEVHIPRTLFLTGGIDHSLSLFYLFFATEPSVVPAEQQSGDEKHAHGKQGKPASQKPKKQPEQSPASRPAARSKLYTQIVIDGCDLFLPGSAVGWIPADLVTVGVAGTISTVLAGRDIWHRVQSTSG